MSEHELRPLLLDELEPVIEVHREAVFPHVPLDRFRRAWLEMLRTRWARGHIQIMGWFENGTLIGSFRLYRLEMLINGRKRACAGVGTLLGLGGAARRDFSGPMLDLACRHFASQFSVCLVFANMEPRMYRTLGFFPLPNLKYILSRGSAKARVVSSADREGAEGGGARRHRSTMMVGERLHAQARVYQPSDLPDLIQIYNLDVSLRKLGILRSEAYWQHLFERDRIEQGLGGRPGQELKTWVCQVDGSATGYMIVRQHEDRIEILESPAESFRSQSWMLRYAVTLSHHASIPRLESQLPLRPEDRGFRVLVRRDTPLMMLHPLASGIGPEDFPYPAENFLWSRDRF